MKTVFELDKAIVYVVEDGIIELTFKNNVRFDLPDALEVDEVFRKLINNKSYYALVDGATTIGTITEKAREHFAKKNDINIHRRAEALVAESFANRIIANLYMMVHGSDNPVRVFSNREEALEWLRILKRSNTKNKDN